MAYTNLINIVFFWLPPCRFKRETHAAVVYRQRSICLHGSGEAQVLQTHFICGKKNFTMYLFSCALTRMSVYSPNTAQALCVYVIHDGLIACIFLPSQTNQLNQINSKHAIGILWTDCVCVCVNPTAIVNMLFSYSISHCWQLMIDLLIISPSNTLRWVCVWMCVRVCISEKTASLCVKMSVFW